MILDDFILPIVNLSTPHFTPLFVIHIIYVHSGIIVEISNSKLIKFFRKRLMMLVATTFTIWQVLKPQAFCIIIGISIWSSISFQEFLNNTSFTRASSWLKH